MPCPAGEGCVCLVHSPVGSLWSAQGLCSWSRQEAGAMQGGGEQQETWPGKLWILSCGRWAIRGYSPAPVTFRPSCAHGGGRTRREGVRTAGRLGGMRPKPTHGHCEVREQCGWHLQSCRREWTWCGNCFSRAGLSDGRTSCVARREQWWDETELHGAQRHVELRAIRL